jgi:hypothetical protein
VQKAQQDADKQVQQLQADADSHAGLMRHLSWQLEAAQQALQQQQQQVEQQVEQPPGQEVGGSAAETSGALSAQLAAAADRACSVQRQWSTVLQFLADEVQALSQHDLVHQFLTNQLLKDASGTIATMVRTHTLQPAHAPSKSAGSNSAVMVLACTANWRAQADVGVCSLTTCAGSGWRRPGPSA